jgi:hypothetical protein
VAGATAVVAGTVGLAVSGREASSSLHATAGTARQHRIISSTGRIAIMVATRSELTPLRR